MMFLSASGIFLTVYGSSLLFSFFHCGIVSLVFGTVHSFISTSVLYLRHHRNSAVFSKFPVIIHKPLPGIRHSERQLLSRILLKPHIYLNRSGHRKIKPSVYPLRPDTLGKSSHIAVIDDPAILHDHRPVAYRKHILQTMFCHDDSRSKFSVYPHKAVYKIICRYGIELARGLIQHQHLR